MARLAHILSSLDLAIVGLAHFFSRYCFQAKSWLLGQPLAQKVCGLADVQGTMNNRAHKMARTEPQCT